MAHPVNKTKALRGWRRAGVSQLIVPANQPIQAVERGKLVFILPKEGNRNHLNITLPFLLPQSPVTSAGQKSHPIPAVGTLSKKKKSAVNYHIKSNQERGKRAGMNFFLFWGLAGYNLNRVLHLNTAGGQALATALLKVGVVNKWLVILFRGSGRNVK